MTVLFGYRSRNPHLVSLHRQFEARGHRAIRHLGAGSTAKQVARWTGFGPSRVAAADAVANRTPISGDHDCAVDFLFCLIEWAGHDATCEHLIRWPGGRGSIDLLAEIHSHVFVIEYKTGRLGEKAAEAAEAQVLRYHGALGTGTPLVVTERPSVPCPTVECLTIDEFCDPLFAEVADLVMQEPAA